MKAKLLIVCQLMLALIVSHAAAATTEITAFPPQNCTPGLTMYMGWDSIHSTSCNSGQDILRQTLGCSEGQQVIFADGKYTCKTPVLPPACGTNELLTFNGTAYACVHTDVPACEAGQVLTFNGAGFICVNITDKIPTCEANQFLTYSGSAFQCASSRSLEIPVCAGGEVLSSDGTNLRCVAATCPAGQAMIGMSPTGPLCKNITPQTVSASAGGWYLTANGHWYSDVTVVCPSGQVATGGGGSCDASAGPGIAALIYSQPSGASAYYASCMSANPSTTNPLGRGVTAFAYCM